MNLYEIESEILNCIDPETGEIIDLERLDGLEMERNKKIENILCWIKNLESDAKQIKEEEKSLADRRKTAENKAKSLRNYIGMFLNGAVFKSPKAAVTWRKSEAVVVDDMRELTDDFVTYKDPEPDKVKIKAALKSGIAVAGCHLEERHNMTIK